jgi:hypothetical protein
MLQGNLVFPKLTKKYHSPHSFSIEDVIVFRNTGDRKVNTFNFEDMLRLGASHLESLVDSQGRTYFDIFQGTPAEAVTDWPDFVDLPARYLEAAAMVEPVLGRPVKTVPALRKWLFSFLKPDGLAYRPDSPISKPIPELFDQARLMYMLTSWVMVYPEDKEVREHLEKLCQGIASLATLKDDYAYINEVGIYFGGTLIRPLVQAGLVLNNPEWVEFGGKLARGIIYHSNAYGGDGSFEGHVHGHLGTQAGILAYAVIKDDKALIDRVKQIFDWAVSISTSFGFVPELAKRKDDMIASETCTIMDYLDVALLLARHVDERYWDIVEKTARNHLAESQIRDASWLAEEPKKADEEGLIRSNLRQRVIGSFAGWSAPHALLAYEEEHHPNWVRSQEMKPRYIGKIRALQNCCAGGGIRAVHQVWSNVATFKDNRLSVNMLIDKKIPEAKVTSFIPVEGLARVEVYRDCEVRVRVLSDVNRDEVRLSVGGRSISPIWEGVFVNAGRLKAGEVVEIKLPLLERTEEVVVGNEGHQQYRYRVHWKGDMVMKIEADPTNAATGYTWLMDKRMKTFYGPDAPGQIYRRESYESAKSSTMRSNPTNDERRIDWYSL